MFSASVGIGVVPDGGFGTDRRARRPRPQPRPAGRRGPRSRRPQGLPLLQRHPGQRRRRAHRRL